MKKRALAAALAVAGLGMATAAPSAEPGSASLANAAVNHVVSGMIEEVDICAGYPGEVQFGGVCVPPGRPHEPYVPPITVFPPYPSPTPFGDSTGSFTLAL